MRIFDPIHSFIYLSQDEIPLFHSKPVQRMRYIHQLAMAYMIYPGGSHSRFEHSLGVMHLATKVFDAIIHPQFFPEEMRQKFSSEELLYWKKVVRMGALCHDIGHLPFSHASEEVLLSSESHEDLTMQYILSDQMKPLWENLTPALDPKDVAKCAVGPHVYKAESFSPWEIVIHKIIGGNAFGVDRIDYLLRDSYHTGLKYGRFDHEQLLSCLRIFYDAEGTCDLGVDLEGLPAAESLLMARYFMFRRLYWHPTQIIQTMHLHDYLLEYWEEVFPDGMRWGKLAESEIETLMQITDGEVLIDMRQAFYRPNHPRHQLACRILGKDRFVLVCSLKDIEDIQEERQRIEKELGSENVRFWKKTVDVPTGQFWIVKETKPLKLASETSHLLGNFPKLEEAYLYCYRP